MIRKYPKSVGEPESFDATGRLTDRKLTWSAANAMVQRMQQLVPQLGAERIYIDWETYNTSRKRGSINVKERRMYLFPAGQQEKTVIHELAHLIAPSELVHGPRSSWWERHGRRFRVAVLRLECEWSQELERQGAAMRLRAAEMAAEVQR